MGITLLLVKKAFYWLRTYEITKNEHIRSFYSIYLMYYSNNIILVYSKNICNTNLNMRVRVLYRSHFTLN